MIYRLGHASSSEISGVYHSRLGIQENNSKILQVDTSTILRRGIAHGPPANV